MRRRMASALCLAAICVAAGLSAFLLDPCCEADADCAPCASVLCWVGQGAAGPRLIGPVFRGYSGSAILRDSTPGPTPGLVGDSSLTFGAELFEASPPGFRLSLRV